MKIEDIQKIIQQQSSDLYSFAYILIPDDLQASQLLIDGVQSFLVQKNLYLEKLLQVKSKTSVAHSEEIKMNILKMIYEISRKRYQQLKMSFQEVERSGGFFALDLDEKCVLFLKEKFQFEIENIEFVVSMSQAELLAYLYSARVKMTGPSADGNSEYSINEGKV